jgi:hypothetical protein
MEPLAGLVTPDTIPRWYRELIAKKYDGPLTTRTSIPLHRSRAANASAAS